MTAGSTVELFAGVAARSPDAPALIAGDETVSFGELDRRATRLAQHLIDAGVRAETAVAVWSPRSVGHVTAILAIWRAGGVSVPIDPWLPRQRIDDLLARSGAEFAIAGDGSVSPVARAEDRCPSWDTTEDTADPLAYIFFTSGSSGVPKAVGVPHAGIVNEARWTAREFGLHQGDRGSWLSSPGFAISRWELWSSLTAGVGVAIADGGLEWDAPRVRDWLLDRGVTWSIVVTRLAEKLFAEPWPRRCRLRLLVTGGEQLRIWPGAMPFEVVNSYGVTETSGVRIATRLCGAGAEDRLPPIGRPISNTHPYVLDAARRPVPDREIGELYLGGTGLARGYLGQPELTAERFLPDPFAPAGGRMYRTGDLVRVNRHGDLEYLGRADNEAKVAGVRVNVSEVESVLLAHPAIQAAAATARSTADGRGLLIGYVVTDHADEPAAHELRAFVARRLPSAMVPTIFVRLPEFPLLLSGKIDRSRLPAPDRRTTIVDPHRGPRDEVERAVVAAFADVLDLDDIGIDDDFFGLGGESLGLVRVCDLLARQLDVELPLAEVFQERSPRLVAALLRRVQAGRRDRRDYVAEDRIESLTGEEGADLRAVTKRVGSAGRVVPPTSAQRGLWLHERLHPGTAAYLETTVIRLTGPLDLAALRRAVAGLARKHDAFRTAFVIGESGPVAVVHPDLDHTIDCPSTHVGAEVLADETMLLDRLHGDGLLAPVQLDRAPLVRLRLYRASEVDAALAVVVHHIVWDGASASVLVDDLSAGYAAALGAGAEPAPEPAFDQLGYVVDERRTAAQEAYWVDRLAGASPWVWPQIVPRSPTRRSGVVRRTVPTDLDEAVRARGAELACTPFVIGLAAVTVALHRFHGQDEIVIGTPMSVRPPEAHRVIGLFVNTVPLRLAFQRQWSRRAFLDSVRTTFLDAWSHRLVPFERLVGAIAPQRVADATPFAQVLFAYNHLPGPTETPGGLRWRTAWLPSRQPRCDLLVCWNVTPDEGISLRLEYDVDRFPPAVIDELADSIVDTLASLVADVDGLVGTLPGLSGPVVRPAGAHRPADGPAASSAPAEPDDTSLGPVVRAAAMDLWRETLGVPEIHDTDDFFELGGKSLQAARVVTKLTTALGREVPLRLLFETESFGEFIHSVVAVGTDPEGG